MIGWWGRHFGEYIVIPFRPTLPDPPPTLEPARCPDCDRFRPSDRRGYHFCDSCGISW